MKEIYPKNPTESCIEKENIAFSKTVEPTEPQYRDYKFQSEKINRFLRENDIKLYSHQVEAIEKIKNGWNVVITTPTASGKSMIYMLSILEKIEQNRDTRALVVFPLNALARDQEQKIKSLIKKTKIDASVESYYGDTPLEERVRIRKNQPNILITTPDMLNQGILPYHYLWKKVYSNLEFVVIDEIHAYRGVLGSHVANVFRRLNRLSMHYQDKLPRYICNSATIRNPTPFAKKLTSASDFIEIARSGSPSPEKVIKVVSNIGDYQLIDFIISNLKDGIPTLVFIDNRKGIELLYLNVIDKLKELGLSEYISKVKTYRAGYQDYERKEIENALANGDALVVLSTSALEMGIDIGEVECVIVKGFPGTLAALWQRFGRAGRRGRTAYNYFIVGSSAIDQYYLKNPEEILHKEVEEPVIAPSNKEIFKKHLIAMANELPLTEEDILKFNLEERQVLNQLLLKGALITTGKGVKTSKDTNPFFTIRSIGGIYKIIDKETNNSVGELSEEQVLYEAYIGAVYMHLGNKYKAVNVDKENKIVYVEKNKYNYYTKEIISAVVEPTADMGRTKRFKDVEIRFGDVKVISQIKSYKKVDIKSGKSIETIHLDKPIERVYNTKAFWITLPRYFEEKVKEIVLKQAVITAQKMLEGEFVAGLRVKTEKDVLNALYILNNNPNVFTDVVKRLSLTQKDAEILRLAMKRYTDKNIFKYGLYGVENAIISIFSIFAMNDKRDIDSASDSPELESSPNLTLFSPSNPTVFIFDAYEGGLGYAEVGFERIEEILEQAYKNVKNCNCISGCPACVLSYKHEDVDKLATEIIFELILDNVRQ